MEKVDVVIIGAGLVGLAIGAEIVESGKNVVIIEKNEKFGQETSSRNSEVIHSGIHYKPGSLKAKLCVEGNERLYDICEENNIGYKKIQKLTVANNKEETEYLVNLVRQGETNGVGGIRMLTKNEVNALEPQVKAECALLTPSTGIIDSHRLMEYFLFKFKEKGGMIIYNSEVIGVEKLNEGYQITIKKNNYIFISKKIINSAGLFADKIASLVGIDPDEAGYRIKYCKGEYFKINRKLNVKRLIYGVPKDTSGLGIHLVIDLGSELKLGPNAFFVDKIDYNIDINHRKEFFNDAKSFFGELKEDDLTPDTSGIRPKLALPKREADFIIKHESDKGFPGMINLIGIESPGLTSSPAIAKLVKKMVMN
ncbi:NAD(P)/FAD-dependent oxidoreductase [Elusimicrobiota bacterium]